MTEKSRGLHAHRQRARYRRRCQRQYIDFGAHGFQTLFLPYAKAVFFIDDDQAQTVKGDLLADQLVGANDDVDLAFGQFFQRQRRFLGSVKA